MKCAPFSGGFDDPHLRGRRRRGPLRDLWGAARAYGDKVFSVYKDERVSRTTNSCTGDVGHLDAEDMILRGGENVYSTEVDAALYERPAVPEAAVFRIPHPAPRRGGGRNGHPQSAASAVA